ncbi:MAG: hypothetical protein IPM45_03610 [Acidimicrobiales bacterium]|nr:hypothetical protein [Acidimicrobiales bacterium]
MHASTSLPAPVGPPPGAPPPVPNPPFTDGRPTDGPSPPKRSRRARLLDTLARPFRRARGASTSRRSLKSFFAWQAERERLAAELALAEAGGVPGAAMVEGNVPLGRGERVIAVFTSVGLVETRRPTGARGAVAAGRHRLTRGSDAPVETPTTVDSGVVTLTTAKVVFAGEQKTRTWAISSLAGCDHHDRPPWTALRERDKEAVSGLSYPTAVAPVFRRRLRLAMAVAQGSAPAVVAELREKLAALDAQRPEITATEPERASASPPSSPPPGGHEEGPSPSWRRRLPAVAVGAVGLLLVAGAVVVARNQGESNAGAPAPPGTTAGATTVPGAATSVPDGEATTVPSLRDATTVPGVATSVPDGAATTVPSLRDATTTVPSGPTTTAVPRANRGCTEAQGGEVWEPRTIGEITCVAFEGQWVWIWTPPVAGDVCERAEIGRIAYAGAPDQLTCRPEGGGQTWVPSAPPPA